MRRHIVATVLRRGKSSSASERSDKFHNTASAMGFRDDGATWLQRLGLVESNERPNTEFERYKTAAEQAEPAANGAGLALRNELLFAGEDGDWLKKLPPSEQAQAARAPRPEATTARTARRLDALANFSLTPRDLKARLDQHVVGQHEAKRALAVALADHFQHARACVRDPRRLREPYHKRNVLLLGPSGVGKTALLRAARLAVDAPLVTADATAFSATGYVGREASDLAWSLLGAADGDADLASFGVCCVDEVDKLCSSTGTAGEVNTRDVQAGLLKLVEDAEIDLDERRTSSGREPSKKRITADPDSTFNTFSTKRVLFVFCGAFTKLLADLERRGDFTASPDDLVAAGLIRELVGRLAVRVRLDALSVADLEDILAADSYVSPLRQARDEFAAYGIDFRADASAIAAWAEAAHAQKTGARGLATVVEDTLRAFKYELAGTDLGEVRLDAAAVRDPRAALAALAVP